MILKFSSTYFIVKLLDFKICYYHNNREQVFDQKTRSDQILHIGTNFLI